MELQFGVLVLPKLAHPKEYGLNMELGSQLMSKLPMDLSLVLVIAVYMALILNQLTKLQSLVYQDKL
jgi:hypothetical protein